MASYDSKTGKTTYLPPMPLKDYPGWDEIDCGCCGGIRWGGESPEECPDCDGAGYYCRHRKSGVCAHYPGGPFV